MLSIAFPTDSAQFEEMLRHRCLSFGLFFSICCWIKFNHSLIYCSNGLFFVMHLFKLIVYFVVRRLLWADFSLGYSEHTLNSKLFLEIIPITWNRSMIRTITFHVALEKVDHTFKKLIITKQKSQYMLLLMSTTIRYICTYIESFRSPCVILDTYYDVQL